jgi:hypothetical protein
MSESIVPTAAGLGQNVSAARSRVRGGFFLGTSMVLLAIVLAGFARTFYLRTLFGAPEMPLYLYVHGAILTGWYAWLIVQTSSVAARRVDLHRRFGLIGVGFGIAVLILGALTTLRFGPRLAQRGVNVEARLEFLSEIVWANIQMLICFAAFLAAAVVYRRRPQIHKRLMLLASIGTIPPAASRIFDWPIWGLGNNALLPVLCTLALFVGALGLYDLRSLRSVHRVTLAGGGIVIASFAVSGLVMPKTEFGRSVVYALYNFMR